MIARTNNDPAGRRARGARRTERGVAMLMVLVALVVTSVLTTAIVTSRDQGPVIGENAVKLSSVNWGARSAANMATATLDQLDTMLEDLADPGVALENLQFGDAHVKVFLTDMEGNTPKEGTRELMLWAYAEIDGVLREIKQRIVLSDGAAIPDCVDLMHNEFTVVAVERLVLDSTALIPGWELCPEAILKNPTKVCLPFSSASDFSLANINNPSNVLFCTTPAATSGLEQAASDPPSCMWWSIPMDVPIVSAAPPLGLVPTMSDIAIDSAELADIPPGMHGELSVSENAQVRLAAGAGGLYAFSALTIDDATVVVDGQATILVAGDLALQSSGRLLLADDTSSATIYVLEDLSVNNSRVGALASDPFTGADPSVFVSPSQFQILGPGALFGGSGSQQWLIESFSDVIASIHAPEAGFELRVGSKLFGRVTAREVQLRMGTQVLGCGSMDERVGFSSKTSPMWNESAQPIAGLVTMLDDAISSGASAEDVWLLFQTDWETTYGTDVRGGGVIVFDDGGSLTGDETLIELDLNDDDDGDGAWELTSPLGEVSIVK